MSGIIQPEFIMPLFQHGNDPEDLSRIFLFYYPKVTFTAFEEIKESSENEHCMWFRTWTVITSDIETGSEKCVCTLTEML